MEKFKGKVAIVTGASAGIGAAIAKALVQSGLKVVGLARRRERVEKLAKELSGEAGKLYAVKADMTKEEDILQAFKWTTENVGPVTVLINNAGVIQATEIIDGDTEKWRKILDTNVLGLTIASREAIKIMRDNKIDGHIININSTAGHHVLNFPGFNVYCASKFAVTALTETLRLELIRLGSKIKITSLSPGVVNSELAEVGGLIQSEKVKEFVGKLEALEGVDIANAALYILGTPPHVQVTELIIKPHDPVP